VTHDEAALLAAVLAGPDDDLPRLVYADWLDENGRPERAEFIRVQCELAQLPRPVLTAITGGRPTHADYPDGRCAECTGLPHECRYHALESRAGELLDKLRADQSFPEMDGYDLCLAATDGPGVATLRRGFVDTVVDTTEGWAARADAILARQPVSEVRLTTWPHMHIEARVGDDGASQTFFRLGGRETWHPSGSLPGLAPDDGTPYLARDLLYAEWPTVGRWRVNAPPPDDDNSAVTTTLQFGSTRMTVAEAAAALRAADPSRSSLPHRILRGISRLFGTDE
jgi:uncharacterized protein (TIGR02996 family)